MKKMLSLIAVSFLVLNISAQSADDINDPFCAEKKNGKLVVMHNGKEMTKDETTKEGATIKTNGEVIKKDGTTFWLKEGECVNPEGKLYKKLIEEKKEEKK